MKFPALLGILALLLAPATDPAESSWRNALELVQAGQYQRADGAFSRLIERFPDSSLLDAAYWQRLELARDAGDHDYLDRLLDALVNVGNPELKGQICLELAHFFRSRGLSGWAVQAYAHRLTLPGDEGRDEAHAYLRYRAGQTPLDAGEVQFPPEKKAREELHGQLQGRKEISAPYAGADIALWEEALDLADVDPRATRRTLLRFIDLYPDSSALFRVYLLLARLEEKQGNPASAMNLLRVTLDRSTDSQFHPEAHALLGFILIRQEQPDRALRHLEAGGEILAAAAAAAAAGNHPRALEHARTACQHYRVQCFRSARELKAGLDDYVSQLTFRDLGELATLDRRVMTAIESGRALLSTTPGQALQEFRNAVELDPLHDGARLGVSLAALLAGGYRECDEALETLWTRHPTDRGVIRLQALRARMNRQLDREGRALFRLLSLDPGAIRSGLQRIALEGVDFHWPVSH